MVGQHGWPCGPSGPEALGVLGAGAAEQATETQPGSGGRRSRRPALQQSHRWHPTTRRTAGSPNGRARSRAQQQADRRSGSRRGAPAGSTRRTPARPPFSTLRSAEHPCSRSAWEVPRSAQPEKDVFHQSRRDAQGRSGGPHHAHRRRGRPGNSRLSELRGPLGSHIPANGMYLDRMRDQTHEPGDTTAAAAEGRDRGGGRLLADRQLGLTRLHSRIISHSPPGLPDGGDVHIVFLASISWS